MRAHALRLVTFMTVLCAAAASAAVPKLASPGLRAIGFDEKFADFLNEQLAQGLRESGVEVVTAQDIRALIGLERQKQMLGCKESDNACMAELADALGVDGTVVGDVVQFEKSFQLSVRVISTNSGRVMTFDTARAESKEALADAAVKAGRKMGLVVRGTPASPKSADVADAGAAPVAVDAKKPCAKGQWCQVDVFARWITEGKEAYDLNNVWASAPDNVWAVGYGATVGFFDGQSWTRRDTPTDFDGILRAVWSPSPQLAYVAGNNGGAFKWKGQGWINISEPKYASFYTLHGTPDGKTVWAATDKGVLKLEGSEWKPAWAEQGVSDVFALSATEAWAVGEQKVLRFRDGKWTAVASAPKEKFTAVFALSSNEVWIAADGVLLRHNPSKKGDEAWKRFPQGRTSFSALWGTASEDLWAGGTDGALLHFDGEDWVSLPTPAGGYVFGLTGAGKDDLWFVQSLPNVQTGAGVFHYRRGQ